MWCLAARYQPCVAQAVGEGGYLGGGGLGIVTSVCSNIDRTVPVSGVRCWGGLCQCRPRRWPELKELLGEKGAGSISVYSSVLLPTRSAVAT